ncbi:hypothetical protein [Algicola sagamiensis]|uniref:hypothetical protein n=1 Tax=Algicola sagamiensis TaxID=163869 RepID=UPI00037A624A|nr:hypothetical protein [Algicola sagamiensis]
MLNKFLFNKAVGVFLMFVPLLGCAKNTHQEINFDGCILPLPIHYQDTSDQLKDGEIRRLFDKERSEINSIELYDNAVFPYYKTEFDETVIRIKDAGVELIINQMKIPHVKELPKRVVLISKDRNLNFLRIKSSDIRKILKGCISDKLIGAIERNLNN